MYIFKSKHPMCMLSVCLCVCMRDCERAFWLHGRQRCLSFDECNYIHFSGAGLSTLTVEDASRAASNDKMHSKLSTLADAGDVKLIVESFVDSKAHWRDIVNFRVVTKDGGYPKIHLVDDVTTWRAGTLMYKVTLQHIWRQMNCH